MRNFLFGVATVFVTQALILLGQLMLSTRARAEANRAAVQERGRGAAERIMDLLNKARKFFADDSHGSHAYDDDRVYDVCHEIKAAAASIPDAEVHKRIESLTSVLWYGDSVSDRLRRHPGSIGHVVYNAGVDILGAFLRGEDVASVDTESLRTLDEMSGEAELIELELNAHLRE